MFVLRAYFFFYWQPRFQLLVTGLFYEALTVRGFTLRNFHRVLIMKLEPFSRTRNSVQTSHIIFCPRVMHPSRSSRKKITASSYSCRLKLPFWKLSHPSLHQFHWILIANYKRCAAVSTSGINFFTFYSAIIALQRKILLPHFTFSSCNTVIEFLHLFAL